MYSNDYIFEKFTLALYDLVTCEGDVRSRVGEAYRRFFHIRVDDFPDLLKEKRKKIEHLLTRLSGRQGYIIPDNLSKMKNKTGSKIAALIFEIYTDLAKLQFRSKSTGK